MAKHTVIIVVTVLMVIKKTVHSIHNSRFRNLGPKGRKGMNAPVPLRTISSRHSKFLTTEHATVTFVDVCFFINTT